MAKFQPFNWRGKEYFYSPDHHGIFEQEPAEWESRPGLDREPTPVHICNLYLNLSGGCNLRCEYCFSPASSPGPSSNMAPEIIQAAIIKLARWWKSQPTQREATMTFFGGEPLLNRDGLQHAVYFSQEWRRGTGVPFSYSISTNGTLVTGADMEFFARNGVFVWFSIDGPPEIHDRRRRFRSGDGSSHKIALANAVRTSAVMPTGRMGVRATFSADSGQLSQVIEYLASQGFHVIATSGVEPNRQSQCSLTQVDISCLAEDLDNCASIILRWRRHGVIFLPFERDLASLVRGMSAHFLCDTGVGSLTVDHNGELYPCHRFVGDSRYYLGNVNGEVNLEICEEFTTLDFSTLPGCSTCWARKFCLGCCPAASISAGLPLGHPYEEHCRERKLYALISLKCAVAEGKGLLGK